MSLPFGGSEQAGRYASLEELVWGIGEGGWSAHSPANCWERACVA
jgi:hypothetical protein